MPAAAQSVRAYPARGQSQEQQDRDRSNAASGSCSRRVQLRDQQYGPTGPPPSLLEPTCSPGRQRRGLRRRRGCDRRRRGQSCRHRSWGWRPFRRHAPARDGDAASASTIAAGGRRGATERRLQPHDGGLSASREFVSLLRRSRLAGRRQPDGRQKGTRASLRCLSRGGATGRPQRARGNPQPSSASSPKANSGADDPFACRGALLRQELRGGDGRLSLLSARQARHHSSCRGLAVPRRPRRNAVGPTRARPPITIWGN